MSSKTETAPISLIAQTFSLEDASILCSTIEKWQSEKGNGNGESLIDWLDISTQLNTRSEMCGRSFTPDECRECWIFLVFGAGMPAFNQLREQPGLTEDKKWHCPIAPSNNLAAPNVIKADSTADECSQLNSEQGDNEFRSIDGTVCTVHAVSVSTTTETTETEAPTKTMTLDPMAAPKLSSEIGPNNSFQQIVYSKANKLYPSGTKSCHASARPIRAVSPPPSAPNGIAATITSITSTGSTVAPPAMTTTTTTRVLTVSMEQGRVANESHQESPHHHSHTDHSKESDSSSSSSSSSPPPPSLSSIKSGNNSNNSSNNKRGRSSKTASGINSANSASSPSKRTKLTSAQLNATNNMAVEAAAATAAAVAAGNPASRPVSSLTSLWKQTNNNKGNHNDKGSSEGGSYQDSSRSSSSSGNHQSNRSSSPRESATSTHSPSPSSSSFSSSNTDNSSQHSSQDEDSNSSTSSSSKNNKNTTSSSSGSSKPLSAGELLYMAITGKYKPNKVAKAKPPAPKKTAAPKSAIAITAAAPSSLKLSIPPSEQGTVAGGGVSGVAVVATAADSFPTPPPGAARAIDLVSKPLSTAAFPLPKLATTTVGRGVGVGVTTNSGGIAATTTSAATASSSVSVVSMKGSPPAKKEPAAKRKSSNDCSDMKSTTTTAASGTEDANKNKTTSKRRKTTTTTTSTSTEKPRSASISSSSLASSSSDCLGFDVLLEAISAVVQPSSSAGQQQPSKSSTGSSLPAASTSGMTSGFSSPRGRGRSSTGGSAADAVPYQSFPQSINPHMMSARQIPPPATYYMTAPHSMMLGHPYFTPMMGMTSMEAFEMQMYGAPLAAFPPGVFPSPRMMEFFSGPAPVAASTNNTTSCAGGNSEQPSRQQQQHQQQQQQQYRDAL